MERPKIACHIDWAEYADHLESEVERLKGVLERIHSLSFQSQCHCYCGKSERIAKKALEE